MKTHPSIQPDSARGGQANNIVKASPESIARAVELLQQGRLVGLPTETVYGLAGHALNPTALASIFEVKQRPLFDPLILHFADMAGAFAMARQIPTAARVLAHRFWPGPLTLVMQKMEIVPDLATAGLATVALRVPSHPVAQALLRAFDGPIAAPSANRFGRISPTDAQAVSAELGQAVPLILDGGACTVGLESTVVFLSEHQPVLLRAGGVPVEEIEALLGPLQRATAVDDKPLAPGQLKQHYAPRKPLHLIQDSGKIPRQANVGWLAFGKQSLSASFPGVVENLSTQGDLREAAANFFRSLRTLDDDPRVEVLYAVLLPAAGLGLAINERLERAAG